MISQKLSYDRPVDFLKKWFLHHLKRHGSYLSIIFRPSASRCCPEVSSHVNAAPDLRHTAVHAAKSVNSFMAVRTEYSVVKIVSLGVSANCPRKAAFTDPSGIKHPGGRRLFSVQKNAVIYGIIVGVQLHASAKLVDVLTGILRWYSHSAVIPYRCTLSSVSSHDLPEHR